MREDLDFHPWRLQALPPAVSVWADGVGRLVTYGDSRRTAVRQAVYPHLIIRGSGTFRCPSGEFGLRGGDMFCIWPGVPHDFFEDPCDPWEFYWLILTGDGAEEFGRAWGFSPTRQVLRPEQPQLATRHFRRLYEYYAQPPPRDCWRALALLYELLSACRTGGSAEYSDPSETLVSEARTVIESLLETGINVNGVADSLRVSRSTLLLAFQKILGMTPVEYIRQARLDRARELLQRTDHKLSVISRACGYRTDKYFMRCFREAEGMTADEWRQCRKASDH